MEFRPCIDIHNGKVKQIIGASLNDKTNQVTENFVSNQDASYYAKLYQKDGIYSGHVILLNPVTSPYYKQTKEQALSALKAYPGGLQVGGGITAGNADEFLDAGASHIIVTSYVFKDGAINFENLEKLKSAVGKERIVLDLSCRKKNGVYYIVTDRWQKFTDEKITIKLLQLLSGYADEFLIHAADVEGKSAGIECDLVRILSNWELSPVTYAGGIGSFDDLKLLKELGKSRLHATIGSSLSLFGGKMEYQEVLNYFKYQVESRQGGSL